MTHRGRILAVAPIAAVAIAGGIAGGLSLDSSSSSRADAQIASHGSVNAHNIMQTTTSDESTITAYLTGYNGGMVTYRTAHWAPGGVDNGHYAVDNATKTVPLSADPTIRSAVGLCSGGRLTIDTTGAPTKSCTAADLNNSLGNGITAYADLRMGPDGTITGITEHYVP